MKKTITHNEIKAAFSEIYNSFYLSNRIIGPRCRTDQEWADLITQANEIRKKYNCILVADIINALLAEFERQDKEYIHKH